jgi:hypothetical protein
VRYIVTAMAVESDGTAMFEFEQSDFQDREVL